MRVVGQIVLIGTVHTYGPPDPQTGAREITGTVEGWHVNVPGPVPSALASYEIDPGPITPANVYAGDVYTPGVGWRDTAFLRFADEAQARAVLIAAGLLPDVPA